MIQSISVRIMVEIILIVVCIWMCSGVKLRGEGGFRISIVRLIPACGGVESRSTHDQILVGWSLSRYAQRCPRRECTQKVF